MKLISLSSDCVARQRTTPVPRTSLTPTYDSCPTYRSKLSMQILSDNTSRRRRVASDAHCSVHTSRPECSDSAITALKKDGPKQSWAVTGRHKASQRRSHSKVNHAAGGLKYAKNPAAQHHTSATEGNASAYQSPAAHNYITGTKELSDRLYAATHPFSRQQHDLRSGTDHSDADAVEELDRYMAEITDAGFVRAVVENRT